jgi:putative membrane protein
LRSAPLLAVAWANFLACSPGTNRQDNETGMAGATTPGVLSWMYLANTTEIQLSRLATGKASASVQRIARRLGGDHLRNREEQQALAQRLDISLTPIALGDAAADSAALPPELEAKTGKEFDRAYLEHEIGVHQANIEEIQNRLLPVTRSPELRAYLEKTLTAMHDHLEVLKQLQQERF